MSAELSLVAVYWFLRNFVVRSAIDLTWALRWLADLETYTDSILHDNRNRSNHSSSHNISLRIPIDNLHLDIEQT